MTTYYRYTRRPNPMSDWGHAMFSDTYHKVEHYGGGAYGWTLDESETVNIWELEEAIMSAWDRCLENEDFGQLGDDSYWINEFDRDDLMPLFDPCDIVDSAGWYDHEMVGWLWDFVLEPLGVMAIRTSDGAICFDESLIKPITDAEAA